MIGQIIIFVYEIVLADYDTPTFYGGSEMAKIALCIGINDYPGTGSDLAGCVNDVQDWAAMLQKKEFVVSKLIDKQATGKNIRTAIESTIAKAKSGDLVVIQYSGHGSYVPDESGDEPDGTDECICPHDINSKGPITDDELFELYSRKQTGVKLLVISDSCHSGTVAKFAPITTPPTIKGRGAPTRKVRFLPPATFLSKRELSKLGIRRSLRRSNPPGRYAALLMAGCQDTEYSYDAAFEGRPNGAFTFVATRALAGLSAKATYKHWYQAIRKALPSQQYPQSPNLYGTSRMKAWKTLA
jgi:metacaspase-1